MTHIAGKPYAALSDFLKSRFGCKVFKVTINTGLTCPNRDGTKGFEGCVYCESSTLEPKGYQGETDVGAQLASGIEHVRKRHKAGKFIAYFQINTNTYAPVEYLEKAYKEAMSHPEVAALAISTRPDCVDEEIMGLLSSIKKEKHLWLELGLQSSDDATLRLINRGHTAEDFARAHGLARERGIDVCAHVILGLPGEAEAEALRTMDFLASLNVWGVKFHQLQVIKGTALEAMYRRGEVKALGLEEYARLVVKCIKRLPAGTVVHRLSGDAPSRYIVAPRWGVNKFKIMERIADLILKEGACQGRDPAV